MERIIYIGIDVHKDTNTAHLFGRIDDIVIDYEIGTIASGANHLIRAMFSPHINGIQTVNQRKSDRE